MDGRSSSYCVIGAGTAGIATARRVLESGAQVVIFEQTDRIGGTWNYTDSVGKDKYGLDIHTSMYQGLRTNLPKEVMGFQDFPIPDQEESYIRAEDVLQFLKLFVESFDLDRHVLFERHVQLVERVEEIGKWQVQVKNLVEGQIETYLFDFVFICNGHYHTPMVPNYPNQHLFKGKQLHSHDYRSSEHFKDETVLVIGAGPSGMDIALEVSKKASSVTISHHTKEPFKTTFPSNLGGKPDVQELTETGALFVDGSREHFTVILYCTGYRYSFPFLGSSCEISVEDNYVRPLYKHCININQPTMAFVGIPYYVCAAQMFDLQARFCLKYYTGQRNLPSKEEMLADMEEQMGHRWRQGYRRRQAHMMGQAQSEYYTDLAKTAGLRPIQPVMAKLHNESSQRFNDNLLNFRNDIFRIVDDVTFEEVERNLC
ncbi:senecionine N-oxygenase-like [Toxorhynchites rutilus septentrionalis]|uniref:senecionine N-oxygenase-like n=1 Tax=Toxorhynchites rutilus septentrionalis TaxID=329112 RepID=UPI002479898B|nr:senecionine N-oxygenase-like [Toxorhynchites rutilus septentrionalis]